MFEIKVVPEVNNDISLTKTPDSVLIIRQIKKSGNKAMRSGLRKLEEGLVILDTEYVSEDYAIGMAKCNTALQSAVNKALAELQEDGTVQSIVDKYIAAK